MWRKYSIWAQLENYSHLAYSRLTCTSEGVENLPNNNSVTGFLLASYSFIS